jgi:hypothetical protein
MTEGQNDSDKARESARRTHTDIKKRLILEALEKTLGVVTSACKIADVGRSTFYEWLEKDPEFKKAVDDISDIALDFAESKLHEQIKEKNTAATIFYLKTKGKRRGYIEKTEQDVKIQSEQPLFPPLNDESE